MRKNGQRDRSRLSSTQNHAVEVKPNHLHSRCMNSYCSMFLKKINVGVATDGKKVGSCTRKKLFLRLQLNDLSTIHQNPITKNPQFLLVN